MVTRETANFASVGQVKELISALAQSVSTDLTAEQAQYWIGHKKQLGKKLKMFLKEGGLGGVVRLTGVDALLAEWQDFWLEDFDKDLDFSKLRLPEFANQTFNRLLVMAEGMTFRCLYKACSKLFPCGEYPADVGAVISDRDPMKIGTYAIRIRDRAEADYELSNFSADTLTRICGSGITLEERLLYEVVYFKETGKHLDRNTKTLCNGSRHHPSGAVPIVYWNTHFGMMQINFCSPFEQNEFLRGRSCFAL